MEASPPPKKRQPNRKIDLYRQQLAVLEANIKQEVAGNDDSSSGGVMELIESSSVSGSLARKIRQWEKTLKSDFLEFVMLEMPTNAWKCVADLIHFSAKDFQVSYFLADVHGEIIPEDSFVFCM